MTAIGQQIGFVAVNVFRITDAPWSLVLNTSSISVGSPIPVPVDARLLLAGAPSGPLVDVGVFRLEAAAQPRTWQVRISNDLWSFSASPYRQQMVTAFTSFLRQVQALEGTRLQPGATEVLRSLLAPRIRDVRGEPVLRERLLRPGQPASVLRRPLARDAAADRLPGAAVRSGQLPGPAERFRGRRQPDGDRVEHPEGGGRIPPHPQPVPHRGPATRSAAVPRWRRRPDRPRDPRGRGPSSACLLPARRVRRPLLRRSRRRQGQRDAAGCGRPGDFENATTAYYTSGQPNAPLVAYFRGRADSASPSCPASSTRPPSTFR